MKDPSQTLMYREASQASEVAALQYALNASMICDLAQRLRALNPQIIFTCARGSSDHAATYAKYLIETRLRIPVVSQAPSISSIHGAPLLHMKNQPFIVISQSGKSPDLLLSAEAARKAGALVIALVNDIESPLADLAEIVVPLHAGPETSVAATKSYIATLCALAHLVGEWAAARETQDAVKMLPNLLSAAWAADWTAGVEMFSSAQSMFVLGRGLTLGIAQEAALKFKETSGIHAEAFSMAEVMHGPMALVKAGFPLLIFPPADKAAVGLEPIVQQFLGRDARIAVAGRQFDRAVSLGLPEQHDSVTAPIAMVQSFYAMVNTISVQRGYDPDRPPLLQKVTETI
ncbi:SIS domain-containing protein [Sphingopyxis sp. DBS4]|uniref:SIS domain-containing protein n=1 Tax=Sphingopyxis sp. DBS4 TaxID=2968500 RepID=UPI00214BE302|nr:SIS domain-containing protein [Sphingopyxis sp. DBS4]